MSVGLASRDAVRLPVRRWIKITSPKHGIDSGRVFSHSLPLDSIIPPFALAATCTNSSGIILNAMLPPNVGNKPVMAGCSRMGRVRSSSPAPQGHVWMASARGEGLRGRCSPGTRTRFVWVCEAVVNGEVRQRTKQTFGTGEGCR